MISAGYDLVVRSRRTVTPEGARPATVCVTGERIVAVGPYELPATATEEIDLGEVALLPGLVDTHVHVNEPGRGEWEGFATATGAAVAGGVTTIIDMPLNSIPPTTDPDALAAKRAAAAGQCRADVGFWGGAVPGNIGRLRALHDAGVYGFKCFLSPSGVPEFPSLPPEETRAAMTEIASFDGLLIVHAEDPGTLTDPAGPDYAAFLASRPSRAEQAAVETLIALAADTGCRVHIVHLSAAECLDPIAAARTDGVRVTAETCPHYLTLCAAEIPAGATQFKCCPPIRDAANRDRLWQGLASGVISGVVSDHSPCPPALKAGGFDAAWGGISSVQLGLPVIWTAARARGHRLADVVRWMAEGPAGFAGLSGKGRIAPGHDADLVAFAAEERFTVRAEDLRQRHPVSPYTGQELIGAVTATWLRGTLVGEVSHGRLLHRGGIP